MCFSETQISSQVSNFSNVTIKKMKFFIKGFFCKCDQFRNFLRIWSHLLSISLMENFILCAVCCAQDLLWITKLGVTVNKYYPKKVLPSHYLLRSSHRRCSIKKGFLKISQNSQENTLARVSFIIKMQAEASNFIKKETLILVLSFEICEIFKNTYFEEYVRWLLLFTINNENWKYFSK